MKALGMNLRNRLILRFNPKQAIRATKDKLNFKQMLLKHRIAAPRTYAVIRSIHDMKTITFLPDEFVIKPNRGFGGKGILILRRKENVFWTASQRLLSLHDIKRHIEKILDGQYSEYAENDSVIVEERLYPSDALIFREAVGLPDIRVICCRGRPVMAMIRYPTTISDGKANLSAGALGIGIELGTGRLTQIYSKAQHRYYPLSHLEIGDDFRVPFWIYILKIASYAARISGLELAGIDLIIDKMNRIMVLEANPYPGLEIQNVNMHSMSDILKLMPNV